MQSSDHAVPTDFSPLIGAPHRPAALPNQFADAGRGLVAAGPISYGETILTERPLLCYQSNELEGKVGGGACGVSVYAYLPCRVS